MPTAQWVQCSYGSHSARRTSLLYYLNYEILNIYTFVQNKTKIFWNPPIHDRSLPDPYGPANSNISLHLILSSVFSSSTLLVYLFFFFGLIFHYYHRDILMFYFSSFFSAFSSLFNVKSRACLQFRLTRSLSIAYRKIVIFVVVYFPHRFIYTKLTKNDE